MQDVMMGLQYGQPPPARRNMLIVVVDHIGSNEERFVEGLGMLMQLIQ